MPFSKLFPRLFAACLVLGLLSVSAAAQSESRPRQATQPAPTTKSLDGGRARLENEIVVAEPKVVTEADEDDSAATFVQGFAVPTSLGRTERSMLSAIEERLGVPYRMGATGPNRYDCSGFVWSVFQQAGVEFTRSTARSLWNEFEIPAETEKFKFGTLVFFNHLHHVGIVADENGFFHASTSKGVVYSRFDEYWTKRINGYRRIPLAQGPALLASSGR
ncbi:MAG TPA: C40 family peptidase [Pyrinomonadaceae bacterium]|jgi:cell wall-associated NlpC family hydrolase|nr:C40 family peptidase [Pyrinomonadaceae bacterium]